MNDVTRYPSKEWGYSGGRRQYYAAAVWAGSEGYAFDVVTQTDLHTRPGILDDYTYLVTCGHDED